MTRHWHKPPNRGGLPLAQSVNCSIPYLADSIALDSGVANIMKAEACTTGGYLPQDVREAESGRQEAGGDKTCLSLPPSKACC